MNVLTAHDAPSLELAPKSNPPLRLRIVGSVRNGQIIQINAARCTVGASPTCTLRLRARGVRPLHCLILRNREGSTVRSLSNHTLLNGKPFREHSLRVNDRLCVGPIEFQVIGLGGSGRVLDATAEAERVPLLGTESSFHPARLTTVPSSAAPRTLLDVLEACTELGADRTSSSGTPATRGFADSAPATHEPHAPVSGSDFDTASNHAIAPIVDESTPCEASSPSCSQGVLSTLEELERQIASCDPEARHSPPPSHRDELKFDKVPHSDEKRYVFEECLAQDYFPDEAGSELDEILAAACLAKQPLSEHVFRDEYIAEEITAEPTGERPPAKSEPAFAPKIDSVTCQNTPTDQDSPSAELPLDRLTQSTGHPAPVLTAPIGNAPPSRHRPELVWLSQQWSSAADTSVVPETPDELAFPAAGRSPTSCAVDSMETRSPLQSESTSPRSNRGGEENDEVVAGHDPFRRVRTEEKAGHVPWPMEHADQPFEMPEGGTPTEADSPSHVALTAPEDSVTAGDAKTEDESDRRAFLRNIAELVAEEKASDVDCAEDDFAESSFVAPAVIPARSFPSAFDTEDDGVVSPAAANRTWHSEAETDHRPGLTESVGEFSAEPEIECEQTACGGLASQEVVEVAAPDHPHLSTATDKVDERVSTAGAGDEDSLEAYMQRLLDRIHKGSATPRPEGKETAVEVEQTTIREMEIPPPVVTAPAPRQVLSAEEYVPRSHVPELNARLAVMREIANSNRHSSLRTHARRTWLDQSKTYVLGSFGASAIALASVFQLDLNPSIAYPVLLASLTVAILLAYQAIALRRKVDVNLSQEPSRRQQAESSGSAHEDVGDDSRTAAHPPRGHVSAER